IYQLYSTKFHHYLMLSVKVDREHPVVPSVSSVWRIAQWHEREVYDLFGVLYDNHPDLRRLFLEDDWQGHPLRKDYRDDFMLTME
ncbi:NADH-quinone oxidoreductase subunit C, partial [bacterium]|nr:NADH-quinone oxidoreductase subunit C [bacterium]